MKIFDKDIDLNSAFQNDESNIVPFGKYKGQPIENLLADRSYVEYILSAGIVQKYTNIYNVIIGAGGNENTPTPDHNKIQIKFLSEEFRNKFIQYTIDYIASEKVKMFELVSHDFQFEYRKIIQHGGRHGYKTLAPPVDVFLEFVLIENFTEEECQRKLELSIAEDIEYYIDNHHWSKERALAFVKKENKKPARYIMHDYSFSIEIKPTIGDEFPAVFRQMQKSESDYLLIGKYNGTGATEEQFIKFFATAGIKVVFLRDIEEG